MNNAFLIIRPKLRLLAPQTYWISLAFALFNMSVGLAVLEHFILYKVQLYGAIPIQVWGIFFFVHGLIMFTSLAFNAWKLTRFLHLVGIMMKSTWLLESFAAAISGQSSFPVFVWSFLVIIQIVVYVYFTPRVDRAK